MARRQRHLERSHVVIVRAHRDVLAREGGIAALENRHHIPGGIAERAVNETRRSPERLPGHPGAEPERVDRSAQQQPGDPIGDVQVTG